jgi:hypothetical protein
MSAFDALLSKVKAAADAVEAARELAHEALVNVGEVKTALSTTEKNIITQQVDRMTRESVALNDRIQRA